MLAMHKEIVISLKDLRYISIECPLCKSRVIMDMKETHKIAKEQDSFSPRKCPACLVSYDTAIPSNINRLQETYVGLLPIADRISFRGEVEIEILSK